MPELPEVETVAADLRGLLVGRRFDAVGRGHPKIVRFPDPATFARELRGRTVVAVHRRGKYIVCTLDDEAALVIHLGMTGHVTIVAAEAPVAAHTHLRAQLDDGREFRYDDARRFGRVLLGPVAILERSGAMPALGLEPLDPGFSGAALHALLHGTTRTLKSALLDQRLVAGLGNIYIDEACHLAGVRPTRRGHRLTRKEASALATAVREVLGAAIANRGSSVDTYRDVWNARGKHQEVLRVYGRGGAPCLTCSTPLHVRVVAGRTTVFCTRCQR